MGLETRNLHIKTDLRSKYLVFWLHLKGGDHSYLIKFHLSLQ